MDSKNVHEKEQADHNNLHSLHPYDVITPQSNCRYFIISACNCSALKINYHWYDSKSALAYQCGASELSVS